MRKISSVANKNLGFLQVSFMKITIINKYTFYELHWGSMISTLPQIKIKITNVGN